MADDVFNRLENMKLTAEEEEVIPISNEGRREEIERCTQSLVGKFLTCKPFNKRAALNTLRKAWGLEEGVQIFEVDSNLFQFKFIAEFELERVLREGPWTFDNQVLVLHRWEVGMTARNVKFETVSMWVQIWGAPLDMICPQVAMEVECRLGMVEEVERRNKQDMQNVFMRVKVAIRIAKLIRHGGFLSDSARQKTWTTFKHERLSMHYHYCGMLGHDVKHCASYFAATKNGEQVVCQYGEWLRASGGRVRSSSRQGLEDLRKTKEGVEMEKNHKNGDGLEMDTVEVAEGGLEKFTEQVRRKVGIYENLGNVSDQNKISAEKEGDNDTDWFDAALNLKDETCSTLNSSGRNQTDEPQLKEKGDEVRHVEDEGEGIDPDWVCSLRTRPTWKQLARMVCGPDDSLNLTLPSLGK